MTMTEPTPTTRPRRMAKLDMRRASGVARAANRTQLGADGVPVDGWMVMKSDGTPVEPPAGVPVDVPAELEFTNKADVMNELHAKAEEIRKADGALTPEQALDRAYTQNPALVAAYRDAAYVAPERVERAAPEALPGSEFIAEINQLTREVQERTGKSADAAMTAVLKSDRGAELSIQYRAANGWL